MFSMGRSADGKTLNVMRTCYIADTQEQAEKEAREGINRWYDVTVGLNASRGKTVVCRFLGDAERTVT